MYCRIHMKSVTNDSQKRLSSRGSPGAVNMVVVAILCYIYMYIYIYMGLSENSVPLNPMVNDHYPH